MNLLMNVFAGALAAVASAFAGTTPTPMTPPGAGMYEFDSDQTTPLHPSDPRFGTLADPDFVAMPAIACYDTEVPPSQEMMARVEAALRQYGQRYQLSGSQWGTMGNPTTVTWSFVPDGLFLDADASVGDVGAASNLFSQMDAKFGGIANRATWIAQFQAAFDRWETLSGLNYTRVTSGGNPWDDGGDWNTTLGSATRGQIRIGMRNIDGASSILAYNYFPTSPENALAGNMIVDSSENWGNSTNSYRFLRNTITHEMGHGLGLRHVCPTNGTKLMEPFINTSYDGPRHDDLRGVHARYGDEFENNDTSATATNIGTTLAGSTLTPSAVPGAAVSNGSRTSLDANGDIDWYRSTTPGPRLATITVTPVGLSYDNSTQNANGTCNSGTIFNSLTVANFQFEVYAPDATTIWATGSGNPAGVAESVSGVLLTPGTGNSYYIRVVDTSSPTESQLYTLEVRGDTIPQLDATDGDFTDRVRLTWTAVPGATEYSIFRNTVNNRATAAFQVALSPAFTQWDITTGVQGTIYYFWVEAVQGGGGRRPLAGPDTGFEGIAPSNNACGSAATLTTALAVSGDTTSASADGNAGCDTSTSRDVWYNFTPACTGLVRFDTCNSSFNTLLSIHTGCPGTSVNQIACNNDHSSGAGGCPNSQDSAVNVNVTGGVTYKVRVAGLTSTDFGEFFLRATYLAPSNNSCASATQIFAGSTPFGTCGATTDGPVACAAFGYDQVGSDVWYRYRAPCTGETTISLCGSLYDSKIAVYPLGCPAQTAQMIACNDDACGLQSRVTFNSVTNTSYLLRVGGYNAAQGRGTINISCPICGTADFNNDGDIGTDADIEAFFACLAGNCCATCHSADFDGDGDIGTDADIEAFFRVLAGGNC